MQDEEGPGFSDAEGEGLRRQRADHDRTLTAMHRLEAALGSAAPGRQPAWLAEVAGALSLLGEAAAEEERNAGRVDSLLSDLKRTQPRLSPRVRNLQANYGRIRAAIADLQHELREAELSDHTANAVDYADLRQRIAWTTAALRHHQARESDLIYEAYYDAFNHDLRR